MENEGWRLWRPPTFSASSLLDFFDSVSRFLGDLSEEDPPVPIPNTAVKLLSPDGTAQATVWESRKSPGLSQKGPILKRNRAFLHF